MGNKESGKPKGELISLSGFSFENGSITKSDYFKFLGTDLADYNDIVMTPEQAMKFKNSIARMTHGMSAAIPLHCIGERCFNKTCPFHVGKNYPFSRPCFLEARMIAYLTQSYIEDLDVDIDSPTEMTLVNQLVEADIIDYRANLGLSGAVDEEAGQLMKKDVEESEHGVKEVTNLHPLLEAKEKANQRRLKILEAMVSTRREKYKKAAALKTRETDDASNHLAELKRKLDSAAEAITSGSDLNKLEIAAKKVIDADWKTKDGE